MTKISGVISLCIGILILISDCLFMEDKFWITAIYGIPFIIIGFVIIFRKSEDLIEQINYGRLKNNDKNEEKTNDPRSAWRLFAKNYYLFRGTPSALWLNQTFADFFKQSKELDETTADDYFDSISEQLQKEESRPRQIFDRFNIEFLSTTESAVDDLKYHQILKDSDWNGRVFTRDTNNL